MSRDAEASSSHRSSRDDDSKRSRRDDRDDDRERDRSHKRHRPRDDDDDDRHHSERRKEREHDRSHRHHHHSSSSRRHRDDDEDDDDDRRRRHGSSSSRHHKHHSSRRDHGRHYDDGDEERERRRRRKDRDEESLRTHGQKIIDDDHNESETERRLLDRDGSMLGADDPAAKIPTSASLDLTSHAAPSHVADPAPLPKDVPAVTSLRRDDWMMSGADSDPEPIIGDAASATARGDNAADGDDQKGEGEEDSKRRRQADAEDSFFSRLGRERSPKASRKPKEDKPDPEKLHISSRELNKQLVAGKSVDEYDAEVKKDIVYGGPGHQWRMMKLRRVYETADEEGRPVEEVALERYGSMDDFNEARRERVWLDERGRGGSRSGPSAGSSGQNTPSGRRTPTAASAAASAKRTFMYADSPASASGLSSRPVSRQSFRKPGESAPSTPQPGAGGPPGSARRLNSFQQSGYGSAGEGSKSSSPIPSVFTPTPAIRRQPPGPSDLSKETHFSSPTPSTTTGAAVPSQDGQTAQATDPASSESPLDAAALNKLEAKVMKAELMGAANAATLRSELEKQKARAKQGGDKGMAFMDINSVHRPAAASSDGKGKEPEVQMLPTLDGRGRLYDVGKGSPGDAASLAEAERIRLGRRKKHEKFETHDRKTGELLRRAADDDSITLAEMVRAERFGAGAANQKDMDAELADRIMADSRFSTDLDYMDENSERLARKKMKSDAMKRQFAIQDFARTKKALDTCAYCWQDEGARPPRATVISSGTRAFLALPDFEPLTEGHCLIVPMHHHLSTLEADEDTWEEIKNFMKNLMQLAHSRNEGVVFFETVRSLKPQLHSFIEAVPVSLELFSQLPGYFKEAILSTGEEWSTHKKLFDFSPQKSFRNALVPEMPYFAVMWDYRGEKGYGHVIEDEAQNGADATGMDEDEFGMSTGRKGDGSFPRYFAAEVIGNVLELEPRRWRKPRRLDAATLAQRKIKFKADGWDDIDWTKMLVAGKQ